MPSKLFYVPSPKDDTYVSLSASPQGRLLKKKILPMNGSFVHPGDNKTKIFIDETVAKSIQKNFNDKIVATVQVPAVNDDNTHSEDVLRNLGEVIAVDYDKDGVYAIIDARKHADDFGKTILDSSAFLHMNYIDTTTGNRVGPTLLHVAATNRGHVRNMGDYEDYEANLLRFSADNVSEDQITFMEEEETPQPDAVVEEPPKPESPSTTLDEGTKNMTKDELIAALKEEGVDVTDLQAKADALTAAQAEVATLSAQLQEKEDEIKLSASKALENEDLAKAFVELSATATTLSEKIDALELSNKELVDKNEEAEQKLAAEKIDKKIRTDYAVPAQRDVLIKLSRTDREAFETLTATQVVKLSGESGTLVVERPDAEDLSANLSRYKEMARNLNKTNSN